METGGRLMRWWNAVALRKRGPISLTLVPQMLVIQPAAQPLTGTVLTGLQS